MILSDHEQAVLSGALGTGGEQMAMRIVTEAARMLGAERLVEIHSSHIDGCLYHGDSGALFCEKLAQQGARVKVPATTNVGALNLLNPDQSRLPPKQRQMAYRLMVAHEKMGCRPSWTCAPYQAGMRPDMGQQIAWGESNAVAFANTVLGARTNRYGDFLDIACAITARAPYYGLHKSENRTARILIDLSELPLALRAEDAFFPVFGSLLGRLAGNSVCAITGLPAGATDDQLKALCAGAAATGSLALAHIVGVTPEAPDIDTAFNGLPPLETIRVTREMIVDARDRLSLSPDGPIDSVALGSPHFSYAECMAVLALANGRGFTVPVFICIGRHTLAALETNGDDQMLRALGVEFVVDTCVVVTPVLPEQPGILMTNSAKFAHYSTGNTGHKPIFGTLADCVNSAVTGHVVREPEVWG